jgi:multiple sugar transport system ATP-binding protein
VILGIRPEGFEDAAFADGALPRIDAQCAVLEDVGSDAHIIFPVAAPRVDASDLRAAKEDDDELLADEGSLFNARVDARTGARRGERVRLAVDPERLHFFDGDSGQSLLRR